MFYTVVGVILAAIGEGILVYNLVNYHVYSRIGGGICRDFATFHTGGIFMGVSVTIAGLKLVFPQMNLPIPLIGALSLLTVLPYLYFWHKVNANSIGEYEDDDE